MKSFYTLLLLFFGMFCNAQTFGATALDVKGSSSQGTGKWMKKGNLDAVMMFDKSAKGISDATALVQRMLVENGMSFEEPDMYNSIEGKDTGDKSPEALHNSIQKGNSKINLAWKAKDGSMVQLLLVKTAYEVIVMNAYK